MARIDAGERTMEISRRAIATSAPGITTVGDFMAMLQTDPPQPLRRPQLVPPSMVPSDDGITSVMPSIRDCWATALDLANIPDSEAVVEDADGGFAALLAHCFSLYLECRDVSPDQTGRLQRLIDDGAECVAAGTMLTELRAGSPQIASLARELQSNSRGQGGLTSTRLICRWPDATDRRVVFDAIHW
jgi:hypothetical protein